MGRKIGRRLRLSSSSGISAGSLLLRQRIVGSGLGTLSLDAESIAFSLRNRHPEYRRLKFQPFSQQVSQVLASISHPPATSVTSHDDHNASLNSNDDDSTSRTTMHKRPRSDNSVSPSPTATCKSPRRSIPSLPASEFHFHLEPNHRSRRVILNLSDEESDGSWSNWMSLEGNDSDPEPAFDVIKSDLRDSYLKNSTPKKRDNMETDVVTEKPKVAATSNGPVNKETENVRQNENSGGYKGEAGPRFADFGGMEGVIDILRRKVIMLLWHPEVPKHLGVEPNTGFLLHSPPGCGKTTLAHAIANEAGVPFYRISAPEVVTSFSGASEENIRNLFTKAHRTAPSIIFIDEIDAIASKRENLQREMDRRIVTQLMTCMDKLRQGVEDKDPDLSHDKPPSYVVVIGATNRPDEIDPALRRPGRFDREIALGVPDEAARAEILSKLTKKLRLEGKFDLLKIARLTSGFVGADLKALVGEAAELATNRIMDKIESSLSEEDRRRTWNKAELESISITMADFEDASTIVQPSLRREGFSSIPDVTWEDVGGLNLTREVFKYEIVGRIKHPEDFKELGIKSKPGFLLFGPPGCGKTLIAKAVANEAGANFIHVKGPELLHKYVGESESQVRKIFMRARACSPCTVFFDEIDALTTSRGKESGAVAERVLQQLLVELDGGNDRQGVFVIGATNRIEVIDPAVLRPGRLGKIMYVPLPGPDEKAAIMKAHARNMPIDADVDLNSLARREQCNNLSGADLCNLIDEAAKLACKEKQQRRELSNEISISYKSSIKASHFECALSQITPSISDKERKYYEALSKRYQAKGEPSYSIGALS